MSIFDILCLTTSDSSWASIDGPDSRSGVDYWFRNSNGDKAYVNDDQGSITISVNGEQVYAGE